MKKLIVLGVSLLLLTCLVIGWDSVREVGAKIIDVIYDDPDMPSYLKSSLSKEEFMLQRADGVGMKRGITKDQPFDPQLRIDGVRQLEKQELARIELPESNAKTSILAAWSPIGPAPIPNAQVGTGPSTAASGRVLSIAIHPTNPDIVYVGTAQGGLYRSTNGGTSWTPLLDNALSLAVNTIAIVPTQPETIFVGTGEAGFCGSCFFGVGIYRIDNASTIATLSERIGATEFVGRSVSKIVFHPTNPDIMFVTSASGNGGIGGTVNNVLGARGVFRSTNAMSAAPTFTKMTITGVAAQDRAFADMVMDPGNPDLVLVSEADSFALGEGGVYRSTDAVTAASPTFVRTFATAGTGTTASRTELALHRSAAGVITVYAASAHNGGTIQRSIDGGATWTEQIDNNFCAPQCFYDQAVAVDPMNADNVYIGGSPNLVFGRSSDGGITFTPTSATFTAGLHVDTHAIAVALSNPLIVYFGSDGGIYRTDDVSATPIVWNPLNNSTFSATQFMSIAVHPTDPNFTIGGTQDNGTNFYNPAAEWTRVDGGDGGFALIDQNAADTTNVRMYHAYFTSPGSQVGYAMRETTTNGWGRRGCFGSNPANGITCDPNILFYAPMEQGPGNPNTVYFGSDRLYRSADSGLNHTVVSQAPIQSGVSISAIGISPQNDNVRIVGQNNGALLGTTTGSTTLTSLDPLNNVPNNYIARAVIDPTNENRAYVTLSVFGVANVWKTSNLSSSPPTWASAATGLPRVPVSAFVVDPLNTDTLYAGTDIGVYVSADAGASWAPFGTGLPRVAVFDIVIAQGTPRNVRIATHGRGMWQMPVVNAQLPNVSVSGRILTPDGRGLRNVVVKLTSLTGVSLTATSSSFGFYTFNEIQTGETYTISPTSKRYRFAPRILSITGELANVDFSGVE